MNKQGNIEIDKKQHNCIRVTKNKVPFVMDVNDWSPLTIQEPLQMGIYIKKREAGAFENTTGVMTLKRQD